MAVREWLYSFLPAGGVLTASLFIAWATEVAAFFLSRGLAFALLAFLQVLPEFSVEAVITISAGRDPEQLQFVTANFTGANRLIAGLFIPMTFYVAWWKARRAGKRFTSLTLPATSSLEAVFLLIPTAYLFVIFAKGRLTPIDSIILAAVYLIYLAVVYRLPPEAEDHNGLPLVPRTIRRLPEGRQKLVSLALFILGGFLLFKSAHPFYTNTRHLGEQIGISSYFLIQWIAPLLSEFPEFVTILYWARTGRSQLGVTNAVSSNINQLTLLIGMLPFAFAYGAWSQFGTAQWEIAFDQPQRVEILLTAAQMLFAALVLLNLRLDRWEAHLLIGVWTVQLLDPLVDPLFPETTFSPLGSGLYLREWLTFVYFGLCLFLLVLHRGQFSAFRQFRHVWAKHVRNR